jgi:hypothetical protein
VGRNEKVMWVGEGNSGERELNSQEKLSIDSVAAYL